MKTNTGVFGVFKTKNELNDNLFSFLRFFGEFFDAITVDHFLTL